MLSMRTPSSCSKERGKEKNRYKKEQQQQHKIITAELQCKLLFRTNYNV